MRPETTLFYDVDTQRDFILPAVDIRGTGITPQCDHDERCGGPLANARLRYVPAIELPGFKPAGS